MPDLTLANDVLQVALTPESGGRVISLRNLRSGVEHVGSAHLQSWLKTGDIHDPSTDVLSIFYGAFRTAVFDVIESGSLGCELRANDADVTFRRCYTLSPSTPVITLECIAENLGQQPLKLEFEQFFSWSFGPSEKRHRVVTVLAGGRGTERLYLPPHGASFVEAREASGVTLALCDLEAEETLLQLPDAHWPQYSLLQLGGQSWRGPYSEEFTLAPGESFTATLQLAVCTGVAAVDRIAGGQLFGLLPEKDMYFSDESVVAIVSAGATEHFAATKCDVILSVDGTPKDKFSLAIDGDAFRGASRRVRLSPPPLVPGSLSLGAQAGEITSAATVRVLPAQAEDEAPLIERAVQPDFPERMLHLIASQQGVEGLTVDDLKWLLEQVVVPCGFTHVIFEFNRALRLSSHPELAQQWSYPAEAISDLARFARSLGIEPVPQQNLYGHQHETNITAVYPELQEVPGDLSVYCPTHPQTRKLVAEIVAELLEIYEAKLFHMGHDEIQFRGHGQRVGVCPRCRARPPHEVLAYDVSEIHAIVKVQGARSMMWGDLLIPPKYDCGNVNGAEGEVYRAIDLIPKDVIIADWHYFPNEDYRSTEEFLARGFDVCAAVWFGKAGIVEFAKRARAAGSGGMMFTTWCRPDVAALPLESLLYAAQCFQGVGSVDRKATEEHLKAAASRLWRQWSAWKDSECCGSSF